MGMVAASDTYVVEQPSAPMPPPSDTPCPRFVFGSNHGIGALSCADEPEENTLNDNLEDEANSLFGKVGETDFSDTCECDPRAPYSTHATVVSCAKCGVGRSPAGIGG